MRTKGVHRPTVQRTPPHGVVPRCLPRPTVYESETAPPHGVVRSDIDPSLHRPTVSLKALPGRHSHSRHVCSCLSALDSRLQHHGGHFRKQLGELFRQAFPKAFHHDIDAASSRFDAISRNRRSRMHRDRSPNARWQDDPHIGGGGRRLARYPADTGPRPNLPHPQFSGRPYGGRND